MYGKGGWPELQRWGVWWWFYEATALIISCKMNAIYFMFQSYFRSKLHRVAFNYMS
ncbi:hypothetical protein HanIR_Chr17g0897341 [Helianthus annuus]|nr:hypothetical protein HanIR_Chr17g0897341 [Helianthus annuus]